MVDNILNLESLRILPDLTEMYRYYIYSLTNDILSHGNSLIFRTANYQYFVIEITTNHHYDGCPRLYLTIEPFVGNKEELVYRGRIWETGLGLVYTAVNLVDRLSSYFQFRNNAMRFAEKFLTILGLGFHYLVKDCERVLLMAYGYSAAELFLDLFLRHERRLPQHPKSFMTTEIKTIERAYF